MDTKLVQLHMAIDRTNAILHSNSEEPIERHQSALKALIIDTDHWKRALEEQKIASKQDIDSINKWNAEDDAKISEADQSVKHLKTSLAKYQGETKKKNKTRNLTSKGNCLKRDSSFRRRCNWQRSNMKQIKKENTQWPQAEESHPVYRLNYPSSS